MNYRMTHQCALFALEQCLIESFLVFCKIPEVQADGTTKDKMAALIVERSMGGVTNGPPEKKMGIKCSNTAEVYFDNTPVPAENLIRGVGDGFKVIPHLLIWQV